MQGPDVLQVPDIATYRYLFSVLRVIPGRYHHYWRHVRACSACTPRVELQKTTKRRKREDCRRTRQQGTRSCESLLAEQKPASEWTSAQVKLETGLDVEQVAEIERFCFLELVNVPDPIRHPCALSPRNLLLLTLKWLWRYPPERLLAIEFAVTKVTTRRLIRSVIAILDQSLEYLRRWKPLGRQRIKEGELRNSVGAIDSFPICIPQPPADERKDYYVFKRGHRTSYGWKVQIFTDFHGRINSVSDAFPYGSIHDLKLLRESEVNTRLGAACRALRLAHDVEAQAENRFNAARKSDQQEKEEPGKESSDSHVIAALGDKAYQGHPYLYVPHKRYSGKRMTQQKKEYNKHLSSARVIVENVNKRLEDWKVIGSVYRGQRDAEFVSKIVRVIVSLYNLKQQTEPLRRFSKHRVVFS